MSLLQATAVAADTTLFNAKAARGTPTPTEKIRSAAQDFEAVFINQMLQPMFSGIGNGPFGGGPAAAVWRSFLTDEYAKSFAKSGGIGIADHVERSLLALQEAK